MMRKVSRLRTLYKGESKRGKPLIVRFEKLKPAQGYPGYPGALSGDSPTGTIGIGQIF